MKSILIFAFLVITKGALAQIVNSKIKAVYPTSYYFETQRMQMFRTLLSNDNFLPTPLGERANEIPLSTWSHQIGICVGLSRFVYFDGGVSWMQNGEAYTFESLDSDSSFNYQTRYRYLALPLQLKMAFGDQFKFYGGIGIVPGLYQDYKQDLEWTNPLGAKYDDVVKINNNMNSFQFSGLGSVGIEAQLDNNYTIRFGALYRRQFNNSYNPYDAYVHKSFGWGLNLGLCKKL
jgi:opacity protein-like surface antigen